MVGGESARASNPRGGAGRCHETGSPNGSRPTSSPGGCSRRRSTTSRTWSTARTTAHHDLRRGRRRRGRRTHAPGRARRGLCEPRRRWPVDGCRQLSQHPRPGARAATLALPEEEARPARHGDSHIHGLRRCRGDSARRLRPPGRARVHPGGKRHASTFAALFGVGALRSAVTEDSPVAGGLEMLGLGPASRPSRTTPGASRPGCWRNAARRIPDVAARWPP